MAVPAIDFQVHNSLFLVAHFHTMIIGGVVFGYFAGISYWFPKIFGFKLNERLGKYAFWCWFFGFLLAFVPLYILGLMGATRRLDHYDASLGWQGLFIVAGIGVVVIIAGIGFQLLQLVVSIWKRQQNLDTTGDPWGGRTLEWSTSSPPPVYNFATLPATPRRDAFWEDKHHHNLERLPYEDIVMPRNSGLGILIAVFAGLFGFAFIWRLWWLAILSLAGVIVCLVSRSLNEHTEYVIPAAKVEQMESKT
jgi:cytochrome o ubiquinol oxidase subunit 1